MNKKVIIYCSLFFLLLLSSCVTNNRTLYINEVMSKNSGFSYDHEGDSSDWMEIFNYGTSDIDLENYLLVSDNVKSPKFTFKKLIIEAGQTLLVWCSGKESSKYSADIHIPFKISSSGENVSLIHKDGSIIDEVMIPELKKNEVYGRPGSNLERIGILDNSTPNSFNWSDIKTDNTHTSLPLFSKAAGFYLNEFELIISANPEEQIYFTTDGSIPTPMSNLYESPIIIKDISDEDDVLSQISGTSEEFRFPNTKSFKGTVIRSITYIQGRPTSPVKTATYYVSDSGINRYSIPVISISTDSHNLFDYDTGIYMLGRINREWKNVNENSKIQGDNPANFNQRGKGWAIPVDIEYLSADGESSLMAVADMRMLGGWSRANPIKNFRLDFDEPIKNIIFDKLKIKELNSIVLRTSANDWDYTLFRDVLMTDLVDDLIETQESEPAVIFINGEYWGIHNIRERMNTEYFETHFDIPKKNISVLENEGLLVEGNEDGVQNYSEIIEYIENNDLSKKEHFDYISNKIDIDNFINYYSTQIFYGNTDWPGNNIRFWQDSKNSGKWRWLLYDTDFGFGLYNWTGGVHNDTFSLVMDPIGEDWPNPPWSTFMYRSLMKNDEFKFKYLNRFCDLINSVFLEKNVKNSILKYSAIYGKEIEEHIHRWNSSGGSKVSWERNVSVLRNFARQRPNIILKYTSKELSLGGFKTFKTGSFTGGSIKINSLKGIKENWAGKYFKGVPIDVEAIPDEGYIFTGWTNLDSSNSKINIQLNENITVIPIFKRN